MIKYLQFALLFYLFTSSLLYAQWQRVASFPTTANTDYVWCLTQTSYTENGSTTFYQYAGTSAGVFISNSYGDQWSRINTGLNSSDLNILSIVPRGTTIYSAGWGGVFKSTNLGVQWTSIANYDNGFTVNSSTSMTVFDRYILATSISTGVFRSTDFGTSWHAVNTGLPQISPKINYLYLITSGNSANIYAATANGVFMTPNFGSQWYLTGSSGTIIPSSTDVYCVVNIGSVLLAGVINGIYRSIDMGNNWAQVPVLSAPSSSVMSFAVYGNYVFAGTLGGGIYLSSNFGASWSKVTIGSAIEYGSIYSLAVLGNYLIAGTYQQGVWRRRLSDMISNVSIEKEVPVYFSLEQNYPNPFNPTTTINYSVRESQQHVTLKIYDLPGREIAALVNENKPAGRYSVAFSGANLPSGVYYYILTAGNYTSVKKMILLK